MNENPTPTGEVRVGETIFTNDRLEAHTASSYTGSGLVQLYIRTTDWLRTSYVSTSYCLTTCECSKHHTCGAHACMPIPLEGIETVPYCSRTAIYGGDDVAYSIRNDQKVHIVT